MLFLTTLGLFLLLAGQKVLAGDITAKCSSLFDPKKYIQCCDKVDTIKLQDDDDLKDVCPKGDDEWTCERAECILTARGIMKDGKIDYDRLKEKQDEFVMNYPWANKTAAAIFEECSEEKLKKFSFDMCLPKKFSICVFFTSMISCNEWKKDADCEDMPNKVAECKEAIEKQKDK